MLRSVGIETVRIPTAEIDAGRGPNLARVQALWPAQGQVADTRARDAALTAASLHRLAIALLDAVDAGFLQGERWVVKLDGGPVTDPALIWPYLRLFSAMDRLWGPAAMPTEVAVHTADGWTRFDLAEGTPPAPWEGDVPEPQVHIRMQPELTASDTLDPPPGVPEIVVRSARLPVTVGDDIFEPAKRVHVQNTMWDEMKPALLEVMQSVFAKAEFREGQFEALGEVMAGRDCAVLLPTGAGKSLIYQLAGLCKPGRTLVIDPLIALIEDQQRGLAQHGIDKVVGISHLEVVRGNLDALLQRVRQSDALFVFVAPERFQTRRFREAVREMTQSTPINLAVIDEAHCVSEWGHDFRTSYLTLGRVLREVTRDVNGGAPPLLALTGTASRAVLLDVLAQLGISRDSERSVVQPASFDREELDMKVRQSSTEETKAILTGTLRSLPGHFGVPSTDFFRPRGEDTYSGLVFCPHVSGDYGIMSVQKAAQGVVSFQPAIYSGGVPQAFGKPISGRNEWDVRKRAQAESFKDNSVPLMVSTNAFGMGIDKPNIRYVLHYGMPGSIESYYQEVGRAGRNREQAYCLLIWNERDRARSDRLTMPEGDLEDIRRAHQAICRPDGDSITQQLYFLLNAFQGVDAEVEVVERLIDGPEFRDHLGQRSTIQIAMGNDAASDRRERALYRLMLLGVVTDYLKEQSFEVSLSDICADGVAEALYRFVQRTEPGAQRPSIVEFGEEASGLTVRQAVARGARELVSFIYEIIVESRRRSLREMYVAVRDASAGQGDMRKRVLDYLTQGDLTPILQQLIDAPTFEFPSWESELAKLQGVEDARELRGTAARLLESSPFNPGLLYARAYAEIIHPEGDLQDFGANFEAALNSARERFGVPEQLLDSFASRLLVWLDARAFPGLPLAMDVADRLGLARETVREMEYGALTSPGGDPVVRMSALVRGMTRIAADLEAVLGGESNGR